MKFSSRCRISTTVGSVERAGAFFRNTTTCRSSETGARTACPTARVAYAADGRRALTGIPISTRPRTEAPCCAVEPVPPLPASPVRHTATKSVRTPRTFILCILQKVASRWSSYSPDIVRSMLGFMVAMTLLGSADTKPPATPGPGVSETLARERAAAIRDLKYELSFAIPADRKTAVRGRSIARFLLEKPHRVVFDFAQPSERLTQVRAAGRVIAPSVADGHIVIPAEMTQAGANDIEFEFVAGDEALNRNDEFLYTLFVPARARLTFPCFDQPDLKARYSLTLTVPAGWQAVSNGATLRTQDAAREAGTTTLTFAETPPLPTYLFAFAAGRFSLE